MLQVVRVVSENARPCMYACGCQWKQGGSGGGSTETTGAERHPSGVTHSSCMTSIWLWHTQVAWHPSGLTPSSCMDPFGLICSSWLAFIWLDPAKLHDIHLAWHAQAAWHLFGLTCSSWLASIWLDPVKPHGRTTQTRWNQQMTRQTGRDTLFWTPSL